jgi:hypothetical protein
LPLGPCGRSSTSSTRARVLVPGHPLFDERLQLLGIAAAVRDDEGHDLLDALNAPEFDPWTLVHARWTPKQKNGVKPDNNRPEIAG